LSERFEVAVVGAGPGGLAAGVAAAAGRLSHVVLDRSSLAETVRRYQRGKHVMAEPEALPLHAECGVGFEAGSREAVLERWERDVRAAGVNLRLGPEHEVVAIEGQAGDFTLRLARGGRIGCGRVVLAIGVQGNLRTFGVPGDDLPHVTYQLDDPAEHQGKRIVVVGVGDAGIENALALAEHGNRVAIVNRRDEFDRAKARNRALIEGAIRRGEIAYHPSSAVERIEPGRIVLSTPQGELALDADLVIGRLGAIPPRRFLEGLGISFPSQDVAAIPLLDDRYEASVPGIHLIGALAGSPLIKNCMNQGYEVVQHLLGRPVVPADEPLLAQRLAPLGIPVGEAIARIRREIPLFSKLTSIQLREFLGGSDLRRLPAGEVIFRRNDFSDTFFAILEGSVRATLPASDLDADHDRAPDEGRERAVELGAGEFFGEGSLISGRRRSATVEVVRDATLLEIPRTRMNALIHSSADVKRVLDTTFVARWLENFLPEATREERQRLAEASVLQSYKQGQTLFEEGAEVDGLYLIRRGAVRISRRVQGREVTLNYVQAGNYVGEVGLVAESGRRGATVRAAVGTETIRLPADAVRDYLGRHPELRARFEEREAELLRTNVRVAANKRATELAGFLLDVGSAEATDLLLIDESLCIRCNNCEKACADTHEGISRLDREGGPYFGSLHVPTACQHCENPKCMSDCPPDVIRRHANGEVYIMDGCIGCGNCVANCPYNVIQLAAPRPGGRGLVARILFGEGRPGGAAGKESHEKIAVKCDLCRNLPANVEGRRGWAACVSACPTGAIVRADPRRLIDQILGASAAGSAS
jgi:CRP-like cAMP-binding protein/thioredoxin reductase/Fe-S-cluster-containing hydrogenase component 2